MMKNITELMKNIEGKKKSLNPSYRDSLDLEKIKKEISDQCIGEFGIPPEFEEKEEILDVILPLPKGPKLLVHIEFDCPLHEVEVSGMISHTIETFREGLRKYGYRTNNP